MLFIGLSGIATGASWLCYYYAVQNGIISVVVTIDKLSILVTIAFSYIVFKESGAWTLSYGTGNVAYGVFQITRSNTQNYNRCKK